ncbi:NAD(P)-binding protein [Hypoxylon sp. NC1633]|nr:NAD(P)-binding protein [Hypoxylon sp. NC1633]
MSQSNHIQKVALIGAGGHVGSHFLEELLKTGKHTVTVLTRAESKTTVPQGAKTAVVNYEDESSLVSALTGQQFLVITLSVRAPPDTHNNIVKAAAKAGVPYIMPNVYGLDFQNKKLIEDNPYGRNTIDRIDEVRNTSSSFVAMVSGFWYEWSLALGEPHFGIDIKNKKAVFFDDGLTKTNMSTWNQCGRALAAILSLPETGASPALSDWKNKPLYFDSFNITQRDMLDSVHRVIGTTDADWEITYESSEARFTEWVGKMRQGDRMGFVKSMYTRVFFPNGGGEYSATNKLSNDVLGLPKESLDEATKRAVDMVESGWNPFA